MFAAVEAAQLSSAVTTSGFVPGTPGAPFPLIERIGVALKARFRAGLATFTVAILFGRAFCL